jgi:hypothetical protein
LVSIRFGISLHCSVCFRIDEQADAGYLAIRLIAFGLLATRPIAARTEQGRLRSLFLEKMPFLLLSAADCVVTVLSQKSGSALSPLATVPLATRLANAIVTFGRYLAEAVLAERSVSHLLSIRSTLRYASWFNQSYCF